LLRHRRVERMLQRLDDELRAHAEIEKYPP
jgi:hypothetical protein